MRFLILSLIFSFLFSESSIKVSVDKNRIYEGDSVTLTITVKDALEIPDIVLPEIPGLKIINGPNQSSSSNIQFINGKMSKSATTKLSWIFIPMQIGNVQIPSILIQIGNKTHASKPINISVLKRKNNSQNFTPSYFLEATISNSKPYRGEQIILTYTLFTQVDITSIDENLPKFKSFWTEEIFSPSKLNLREVKKNGVSYYSATIKKLALFPTKSGDIIIEPMTAIIGVREKKQRWNDFSIFGPPSKKYSIATNTLTIEVQPLPINSNGKISAVVGAWDIVSNLSSNKLIQDEAFKFSIIISGSGNLKVVDLVNISFPNELEVFDPEISIKQNFLGDHIGGEKKFEWVIIPRRAGDIYLPEIEFLFFDPKKKKWISKLTSRYHLKINPSNKNTVISNGFTREEVSLIGKDIRFIDSSKPTWKNRNDKLFNHYSIVLFILSVFCIIFPYLKNINGNKINQFNKSRKSRLALKSAKKVLFRSENDIDTIYRNIYKSVIKYVNLKYNVNKVEYSVEELIDILRVKGDDSICLEIKKILVRSEEIRFSPISSKEAKTDQKKIVEFLGKIDSDWK